MPVVIRRKCIVLSASQSPAFTSYYQTQVLFRPPHPLHFHQSSYLMEIKSELWLSFSILICIRLRLYLWGCIEDAFWMVHSRFGTLPRRDSTVPGASDNLLFNKKSTNIVMILCLCLCFAVEFCKTVLASWGFWESPSWKIDHYWFCLTSNNQVGQNPKMCWKIFKIFDKMEICMLLKLSWMGT